VKIQAKPIENKTKCNIDENPRISHGFLAKDVYPARAENESYRHESSDTWKPGDSMCQESTEGPD